MGNTLTYWILTGNNQVLARSLVQPLTNTELNKHVLPAGETLDPAVTEVEGSNNNIPSLDL
eukprot:10412325-Ditylum_brightwellii.AAC.1